MVKNATHTEKPSELKCRIRKAAMEIISTKDSGGKLD
jgi:hypothetical protein